MVILVLYHGARENINKFYEVGLILSQTVWGTYPMDVPQYVRLVEHNAESSDRL